MRHSANRRTDLHLAGGNRMLRTIIIVLLALWVLGFAIKVGGFLIRLV
jgi:hypothetical protein